MTFDDEPGKTATLYRVSGKWEHDLRNGDAAISEELRR